MDTNTIIQGNSLDVLKTIPDDSIDCVVTSPPYFAVRDYKCEGQIGAEDHPQAYVDNIVAIMKECKRIIKPTGSIFLNVGDVFYTKSGSGQGSNTMEHATELADGDETLFKMHTETRGKYKSNWLQHKQRLLIPHRIAIKCQDELGLILRNDIVWAKQMVNWKTKESWGASMPSPVQDRFATHSEYIFFFVKNKKYYFNLDAIRIPHKEISLMRDTYKRCETGSSEGVSFGRQIDPGEQCHPLGKNPGDVLQFPFEPCHEHHFALFPSTLPGIFISATCPEQICKKCGVARTRMYEMKEVATERAPESGKMQDIKGELGNTSLRDGFKTYKYKFKGLSDCGCNAGFTSGVVLDPFMGLATTAIAALKQNKQFLGIELNKDYIEMAKKRLKPYLEQKSIFGFE